MFLILDCFFITPLVLSFYCLQIIFSTFSTITIYLSLVYLKIIICYFIRIYYIASDFNLRRRVKVTGPTVDLQYKADRMYDHTL